MEKKTAKFYPPVVAVLGHVDHGKTSLLDAIRKTDVVNREIGGITQSIGAYSVEVPFEGQERRITFIDTPGHEAFLAMRSRGVSAADIAILVVAANEGVKPQTKESIKHIKKSKIPFVVALTKSDLPSINQAKVKQELVKEGVELEELGGNIPSVLVSAKMGRGIKELLDLILLVWEMQEKKMTKGDFSAVVIESRLDPRSGILVTAVIKTGTLKVGEEVFASSATGKVKAIFNDRRESLKQVGQGEAVEILGFSLLPELGELVVKEKTTTESRTKIVEKKPEEGALAIVLKTDSLGTLEAIVDLLPKEVFIVSKGTGTVNEGDVLLAKARRAIIITFNIRVKGDVLKLAQTEGVIVKQYHLIYELLDELREVVLSLKSGVREETILGKATVLASFPYEKTKVLGVRVVEGRIALGDKVKLVRGENEMGKSAIKSMKKAKEEIKMAQKGAECGLILEPMLDFELGDMLLSYRI